MYAKHNTYRDIIRYVTNYDMIVSDTYRIRIGYVS